MKRTLLPIELAAATKVASELSHDKLVSVLAHFAGFQFGEVNDAAGNLRAPWRNFALLLAESLASECTSERDADRMRRRVDRRKAPGGAA